MPIEQKILLDQCRSLLPKTTFRELSSKTGINASRLFRLFNGHEMRLSEFRQFQILVQQAQENQNSKIDFFEKIISCLDKLSQESFEELSAIISNKLYFNSLSR